MVLAESLEPHLVNGVQVCFIYCLRHSEGLIGLVGGGC
jgi:hypothetical protein